MRSLLPGSRSAFGKMCCIWSHGGRVMGMGSLGFEAWGFNGYGGVQVCCESLVSSTPVLTRRSERYLEGAIEQKNDGLKVDSSESSRLSAQAESVSLALPTQLARPRLCSLPHSRPRSMLLSHRCCSFFPFPRPAQEQNCTSGLGDRLAGPGMQQAHSRHCQLLRPLQCLAPACGSV